MARADEVGADDGTDCSSGKMISVIVPAYEAEHYLVECVRSVCNQAAVSEVIIVDDGSVDETVEVARTLATDDPRIQVVSIEHGGVAAARNVGISFATSPYLAFVDADDVVPEGSFHSLWSAASAFGSDMTYGDFDVLRDGYVDRGPNEFARFSTGCIAARDAIESLASVSAESISGSCWRILFRTDFLRDNSLAFPVGVSMSEDFHFVLDCFRAGPRIGYLDKCVYLVRRSGFSTTQRYLPSLERDMGAVNRHLEDVCEGDPVLMAFHQESVANTVWVSSRNLYLGGSPFGYGARRRYVVKLCRKYRSTLESVDFRGSLPRRRSVLLRLGSVCPLAFWLALELLAVASKGE